EATAHASPSAASVHVLEADDVVLAQIAARLHLDQFQRHHARILEAVLHAQRDVGALVLREDDRLVATRDAAGATDHDPVLGAVVVHLQAQRRAGLHRDALDLETLAHVDRVIAAPRAVDLAVPGRLGAL